MRLVQVVRTFHYSEALGLVVLIYSTRAHCLLNRQLSMQGAESNRRRLRRDRHLIEASQSQRVQILHNLFRFEHRFIHIHVVQAFKDIELDTKLFIHDPEHFLDMFILFLA